MIKTPSSKLASTGLVIKNHKDLYLVKHLFQFNFSPPSLENHFCTSKTFFSFSFDDSIHFCLALERTLTRSHWEIWPKFSLICLLSILGKMIDLSFHRRKMVQWSHTPWSSVWLHWPQELKRKDWRKELLYYVNLIRAC